MKNKKSGTSFCIKFCKSLSTIFIILKLIGVINWSWIWVLSPLWIAIIIALAFLIIADLITIVLK